jgi:malate/lactate dehydrogenase
VKTMVGIMGTGWVGSSVAISVLHSGIANELLLHDVRTDVAEGEAMDLAHGASFYPAASVRIATPAEMREADAIVVAGLHDVALSLPTVVGSDGAMEVVVPRMDARERAGVEHSADVLRKALASL